jgi:hypothetical protein
MNKYVIAVIVFVILWILLSMWNLAEAKMTWYISDEVVEHENVLGYMEAKNILVYGGYSDWRIATKEELVNKKGQGFDTNVWADSPCFSNYTCLKPYRSGNAPITTGWQFRVVLVRGY